MDISDVYMSIGQKRNISHFANIVRIAQSDNVISPEEEKFLKTVAQKYNIDSKKYKEILKNPNKYPTIAHLDCEERIERLYDLLKMVEADHIIRKRELLALKKVVTGLAFPVKNVDAIVLKAAELDVHKNDLETFQKKIMVVIKLR